MTALAYKVLNLIWSIPLLSSSSIHHRLCTFNFIKIIGSTSNWFRRWLNGRWLRLHNTSSWNGHGTHIQNFRYSYSNLNILRNCGVRKITNLQRSVGLSFSHPLVSRPIIRRKKRGNCWSPILEFRNMKNVGGEIQL